MNQGDMLSRLTNIVDLLVFTPESCSSAKYSSKLSSHSARISSFLFVSLSATNEVVYSDLHVCRSPSLGKSFTALGGFCFWYSANEFRPRLNLTLLGVTGVAAARCFVARGADGTKPTESLSFLLLFF